MRSIRRELFPVQIVVPDSHSGAEVSTVEPPPISTVQTIIAQKNFRQEKYLELVKQFMDQTCEYSFMSMIPHQAVRDAWGQFLRDNSEKIQHLNIAWGLTPVDITKLDPRYTYKRVHICSTCKKKQYARCCDGYNPKTKTTHNYMINMTLKSAGNNIRTKL